MVVNIGEDIPSAEAISEVSYSSSEEKDGLNRRSQTFRRGCYKVNLKRGWWSILERIQYQK
jgi:hypothetical protein